jgi:hypothetical protein
VNVMPCQAMIRSCKLQYWLNLLPACKVVVGTERRMASLWPDGIKACYTSNATVTQWHGVSSQCTQQQVVRSNK